MNITVNENEKGVGTLSVVEQSVDGVRSWAHPRTEFGELDSEEPAQVYTDVENGLLTEQDTIANDDAVVFEIQSTSVFGALELARQTDDIDETYEEAFVELFRGTAGPASSDSDLAQENSADTLVQDTDVQNAFRFDLTQDDPPANQDGKELDLVQTWQSNGLNVVRDPENASLFVELRVDRIDVDRGTPGDQGSGGDTPTGIEDGETYELNFSIESNSGIVDDDTFVTDDVTFVDEELSFNTDSGGVIRVRQQAGQNISGTTNVAPGTELDLRIRSTGESPFLRNPQPVVQDDGTFSADVDFSDVAQNASFEASARSVDDTETPGRVGSAATAGAVFNDQETEGSTVTVASASLSEGGFIAIHQGSASGDVIGSSSYLEPGESTNVEIELDQPISSSQTLVAMPHLDDNGNEQYDFPNADAPYTNASGSPVVDSAEVTIATETTTEPTETTTEPSDMTTETTETTTEPTETDEPTDTETAEPTDTDEPVEETTTETGPGFTAVLAVIALLAGALLAIRRREN